MIYAAVRYPDEMVDTFALLPTDSYSLIQLWEKDFQRALSFDNVAERLSHSVPWILAGFAQVVREAGIEPAWYKSFLDAMRRDVEPRLFHSLSELIDGYVYGSAVTVGYFLAHVYGAAAGCSLEQARDAAANLGIALQLTNFCRDVAEDRERGRCYLPMELIERHGPTAAITELAEQARSRYLAAAGSLGVFARDTRPAIQACIDVYGALNDRILCAGGNTEMRHSVPVAQKFRALPVGKYWRLPLAYMGVI